MRPYRRSDQDELPHEIYYGCHVGWWYKEVYDAWNEELDSYDYCDPYCPCHGGAEWYEWEQLSSQLSIEALFYAVRWRVFWPPTIEESLPRSVAMALVDRIGTLK